MNAYTTDHQMALAAEAALMPALTHGDAQCTDRAEMRLDPHGDPYARAAVQAYADACATEQPWLAEALQRQYGLAGAQSPNAAALWRAFHTAQRQASEGDGYDASAWSHVAMHLCAAFGAMNL